MKKVAIAAALLIVVLVGAVFLLPFAVGTSTLRAALERQLSTAAGAEISLAGPVRFSVFPDFGIVADNVGYLTDDSTVSLSASRIIASVRLTSLFSNQIRITGVELQDPRIALRETQQSGAEPVTIPSQSDGDIFQMAAGYLERLSIDEILVSNGEIVAENGAGIRPVASAMNLQIAVPGIEQPASFAFSGTVDGKKMELKGEIGSLRDLLDREPAAIAIHAAISPPPHPVLADLGASGQIQLSSDGSYRIAGGEVKAAGQQMRLDAAYTPGSRDHVEIAINAGELNFSEWIPESQPSDTSGGNGDGATDLSMLRQVDADFKFQAASVQAGDAIARDVVLDAKLLNGQLKANLQSQQIAGGGLEAGFFANFNQGEPEISGALSLASIDIDQLAKLSGQQIPASGRLSTNLQYAFLGTQPALIRESVNLKGVVSISGGTVAIPQLAEFAGPGAGQLSPLDARAEFTDITQPVNISGTTNWNGEDVGFGGRIALGDLLAGAPGTVAIDLKSRPVEGKFTGTFGLDGRVNGTATIEGASADRLLGWLGQDVELPFGRFAYAGSISNEADRLSLDNARITLDDMVASGSVSVSTSGRTTIVSNLSVNAIDFAKLTGGNATGGQPSSSSTPSAIDLSPLHQFDADIRLSAERIGYGDLHAGPASATLAIKDGVARLTVPSAGFYGGSVTADITANGAEAVPQITASAGMSGVSALPLLTDAAKFERLEGKLDAELAIRGSGADTTALARSLNGTSKVVFSDGAIRGIDVAKIVNNLQSLITAGYQENTQDRTEFAELSASLMITNGVGRTEDLRLMGPLVRMDGSGSIDLAAATIDMRLNPRVVGSLAGQGGEFDVTGLGLPVIVTGSLSQPRIYPDVRDILSNPQQALQTLSELRSRLGGIGGNTQGLTDTLKDTLANGAGKGLENIIPGVVQGLGGTNGGNNNPDGGTSAGGGRDLVGSLLQGMLGGGSRQVPQPEDQAALPPPQPQPPVEVDTPQQTDAADIGADVMLPAVAPIPQPNPRNISAAAEPVSQEMPQEQQPIDHSAETVDPVLPQEPADPAADLIKGLINRLGQ